MFQTVSNPFEGSFAAQTQHLLRQYMTGLDQVAAARLEAAGLAPSQRRPLEAGLTPLTAWRPELSALRLTLKAPPSIEAFLESWNQRVEALDRCRVESKDLRRASVDWIQELDPEHYKLLDQSDEAWLASQRRLREAFDFLGTELPEYAEWIALLFQEVAPMQGMENGSRSASFFNRHGEIHLSLPESVVALTTVLIHECSHQHFHLLMACHPLVAKGAPESYSILKGTRRPLQMLLLGYHAFGNVLLGMRLLKERLRGALNQDVDKEMNHIGALVRSLAESIEQTGLQHFEPAGLDIYEPLKARLRSA